MKRIKRNSPTEEAAIQRGIAADPDTAEWSEEDFAQAHRGADVLPAAMLAAFPSPAAKVPEQAGEGAGDIPT